MRRIFIRVTLAAAIVSAIAIVPASPAFAYSLFGCRFAGSGNSLKWQDSTTRSSYSTPAVAAIGAWNSTSTHFNFTKVTSGANVRVTDGNFGAVWMGQSFSGITLDTSQRNPVEFSCSGGTWDTTMVTWFNRAYTDGYDSARRKAIIMHEIGHALGIAHPTGLFGDPIPGDCQTSVLMSYNIDLGLYEACPERFTAPNGDDINAANALY